MASNVKIEQYVTSKSNDEQKLRDEIMANKRVILKIKRVVHQIKDKLSKLFYQLQEKYKMKFKLYNNRNIGYKNQMQENMKMFN